MRIIICISLIAGLCIGSGTTYAIIRTQYLAAHPGVHMHANFGIVIQGNRVDFSNSRYMEDIGSCTVGNITTPRERTHLHNNVADVVHVHDSHVTWADFLRNIGVTIGQGSLITDTGTYAPSSVNQLRFILNGVAVNDPSNTFIADDDRLLISYGSEKKLI